MCSKTRDWEWCGGRVLGYDLVLVENIEICKRRKTKLTINKKESEGVRVIFNEYANGKGYKDITNKINKLGYTTKKGNKFSVCSIK